MTRVTYSLLAVVLVVALGAAYYYLPLQTLYLIMLADPYEIELHNAPQVLVLGDSTSYGTGTYDSSLSVPGRIGTNFAVSIANRSVNGRTIEELLEDLKAGPVTDQYEVILLMIGSNDTLEKRNVSQVENELLSLIQRLNPQTNNLILLSGANIGATPRYGERRSENYEALTMNYREMYKKVAADTSLTYVDLFKERSQNEATQDPETYVALDGFHPSAAGYGLWYEELEPTLSALLPRS